MRKFLIILIVMAIGVLPLFSQSVYPPLPSGSWTPLRNKVQLTTGIDTSYWYHDASGHVYFRAKVTKEIRLIGDVYNYFDYLSNPTYFTTAFGTDAGAVTTGAANTFIGYYSGKANVGGMYNVALGYKSLEENVSGNKTTAIGYLSGQSNTESDNTFIGYLCGRINTTGSKNTFMGSEAGQYNSTGQDNTLVGKGAGMYNEIGIYNVAIGSQAGYGAAGNSNSNNTFVGYKSGFAITTGTDNVLNGYYAGNTITTGSNNILIGSESGYKVGVSEANVYVGTQTGYNNNTGNNNVYLGYNAGHEGNGAGNIFIGYQAGYNETGSNKLYIENSNSATPLIYGDFSTDKLTTNGDHYVTDTLFTNTISPYSGTTTTFPQTLSVGGNSILGNAATDTTFIVGKFGLNCVPSTAVDILTVSGNTEASALRLSDVSTNNTIKYATITMRHYSAAENDMMIISGINSNTNGTIQIGGGPNASTCNPANLIRFYTGTYTTTGGGSLAMTINNAGNIGIGTHTVFTNTISFTGTAAKSIGIEANAATAAGSNLTISAGSNTAGGTADLNGGMLTIAPGQTKGTGVSSFRVQRNSRAASTGTTLNTLSDAFIIPSSRIVANNSDSIIFTCTPLAADTTLYGNSVAGSIHYQVAVKGSDGYQSESGEINFTAVRYAGTVTATIGIDHERESLSSSTLVVTPSLTYVGGLWTVTINVNSGLTSPAIKLDYTVLKGTSAPNLIQK